MTILLCNYVKLSSISKNCILLRLSNDSQNYNRRLTTANGTVMKTHSVINNKVSIADGIQTVADDTEATADDIQTAADDTEATADGTITITKTKPKVLE